MTDLNELERLAKAARGPAVFTDEGVVNPYNEFRQAASPEAVLALVNVAKASDKWLKDGAVGNGSVAHLNDLTEALDALSDLSAPNT